MAPLLLRNGLHLDGSRTPSAVKGSVSHFGQARSIDVGSALLGVPLGFYSSRSSFLKRHAAGWHQHASVNRDGSPGHKGSQIACQKSDNSRYILCAAHLASDMKPITCGEHSRGIRV